MDFFPMWVVFVSVFGILGGAIWSLKKVNSWIYESQLGEKRHFLPPGDLGWPVVGNMWSFLLAFKSKDPESFIRSYIKRYGNTGVYKAFMFGKPSVLVTTAEGCRKVLTDDNYFKPGWPTSTVELIGKHSFLLLSHEEHKRLRRLTAAPINGHEALSEYIPYIEKVVIDGLEKWVKMGEIEFLTHMRKLTFKIIMYIFLSSESEVVMESLEMEYTNLNYGVRSMAINLPGFAFHKALKARKKLVATLQSVVEKRRNEKKESVWTKKKDMMDRLLEAEDEQGRRLKDEEIIDILLMYLNAGHESSGHITMWAALLLQQHPQFLNEAKKEQEEIVKNRPLTQKGLTFKEFRQMEYLSKVIDETFRLITFSLTVFREAIQDFKIGDYVIPKGWKVLAWFRSVHYDQELYPNPMEFNPSRWDNYVAKAGTFLPFGAGSRLCPGNDLAKLEISIFLHYFLLNYKLEPMNAGCSVMYLPHTRPKDNCLARIKKIGQKNPKIRCN